MMSNYDVAIVRIVGNELPPRHAQGSNIEQLKFILAHEPSHPKVKKIWLFNRLVDKAQEQAMVEILDAHGCSHIVLPFDVAEYKRFLQQEKTFYGWYRPRRKQLLAKAGFIIEINRARNKALAAGFQHAPWVIPLDGGCCLDKRAMEQMLERIAHPEHDVYALPTYRLINNENYMNFSPSSYPMHESMILFKRNHTAPFDEGIPYGKGEKLEAILRLFPQAAMKRTAYALLIDDPRYHAGYVVRLSSGNDLAEGKYRKRVKLRFEGLSHLVSKVEAMVAASKE